ncbi:MAG: hypothetical protein ACOX8H_01825 [Ruminococcus sp.]|jgi:tetrahydromethanopterin S-methyltransferase subunit D
MEQNTHYYESPQQDMYQSQQSTPPTESSGLATASLVMGICGLVLICCGASFVLGALGIIFALLSRGRGRMSGSAKAGLILSIVGIILSIAVYSFYIVSLVTSGQFQDIIESYEYYNQYMEDDYDYNDYYDFGEDYNLDEDQLNDLLQNSPQSGDL